MQFKCRIILNFILIKIKHDDAWNIWKFRRLGLQSVHKFVHNIPLVFQYNTIDSIVKASNLIHTYYAAAKYTGIAEVFQTSETPTFYQNDSALRNTADVTGSKAGADRSVSQVWVQLVL
jgi:hypothetical protein